MLSKRDLLRMRFSVRPCGANGKHLKFKQWLSREAACCATERRPSAATRRALRDDWLSVL